MLLHTLPVALLLSTSLLIARGAETRPAVDQLFFEESLTPGILAYIERCITSPDVRLIEIRSEHRGNGYGEDIFYYVFGTAPDRPTCMFYSIVGTGGSSEAPVSGGGYGEIRQIRSMEEVPVRRKLEGQWEGFLLMLSDSRVRNQLKQLPATFRAVNWASRPIIEVTMRTDGIRGWLVEMWSTPRKIKRFLRRPRILRTVLRLKLARGSEGLAVDQIGEVENVIE